MRGFCIILSIMLGTCTLVLINAIRELVIEYKKEDDDLRRITKAIIALFSVVLLGCGFLFCLFMAGSVMAWQ